MKKTIIRILSSLMICAVLFNAAPTEAKVLSGYTSKVDYDNTDAGKYKIDVDHVNQVITVYEKSSSGAFDKIVLQGLCTTGDEENPTGSGTYKLGHLKERFGYFVAFGQYAQYWTQVVRGVYIHTVMYNKKNITTMLKGAYNNLGTALSHGCIRVMPDHAKWIFYNCPPGTTCVISKSREPNPELVKKLKSEKPSYANYAQPTDFKADPPIVPAKIKADNVPLRTGFSNLKDTTVLTLKTGDVVKCLQIGPDWCKVETSKGKLGYVQTKFLSMNPDQLVSTHGDYYAKEKTYLYESPNVNAKKLFTYNRGDYIDVIGSADVNWLTASAGGIYGFIRVKQTTSAKPTEVEPEEVPFEEKNAVIKPGIIANIRSGPGTEYPVMMELQAGTAVRLMEDVGNWYVVMVNGAEGYINKVCIG